METARLELRRHLRRLAVWSVASLALPLALFVLERGFLVGVFGLVANGREIPNAGLESFLVWSAGWAAVNLVICAASWWGKPPDDLRKLREFLMLNEGLNVGYIGVGIALGLAAAEPGVKGAGWAVAIQGLALLVLDTWLLGRLPSALEPS